MERSSSVTEALRDLNELIQKLVEENIACHKQLDYARAGKEKGDRDISSSQQRERRKECADSLIQQLTHAEAAINKADFLIKESSSDLAEVGISFRRSTLFALLRDHADRLPVWRGESDKAPALCGNVQPDEKHKGRTGDHVAARISSCEGSSQWILGVIQSFNGYTARYAVQDIEREDAMYYLQRRHIAFLPLQKVEPSKNPALLYTLGDSVLALYPHTTCFYPGVVHSQPKTVYDEYNVKFEDHHFEGGYSQPVAVSQRYILHPPSKKAHSSSVSTENIN
ncbi:SAGA-associated factor 29-like [Oopsacas minuta]|uniref:SAGA-associated factor 29-like n=1 Tax=Oopsacas minuta TaxID=111878 RepID=A0AAV7KIK3_9METZ|nr:SAGA-associated factor 29-like [Oopsacas minuta]